LSRKIVNISNAPSYKKNNTRLKIVYDDLVFFDPLTRNQEKFYASYNKSPLLILSGVAGSGKTFISLYKALEEILSRDSESNKVIIVRSAVPSRDLGALPGSIEEKTAIYELPYKDMCRKMFGRKDAYERLKEQNVIEFVSTSYVRGLTFDNSIIIVDEFQNLNFHELDGIITRIGEFSKILFCGDVVQSDLLSKKSDVSGFNKFMNIMSHMNSVKHIDFGVEDIVRGALVKEYIIAKLKSGE